MVWNEVMQMKPPPKPPELPTISGEHATAVDINIEQKKDYTSGAGGEQVTVLEFSGNPKGGFTRYSHHLTNKQKMKSANLKKGNQALQSGGSNITANDVKYVHVYYGEDNTKPLFICVVKQSGYDYYKKTNPAQDSDNQWSLEGGIDGAPDNNNHTFLMHLDELNDWANGHNVIHIEKTDTEGTSGSSYTTGSGGTTQITVEKKTNTDPNVPTGYVAYKHSSSNASSINVKFKHNGNELKGLPGSVSISNTDKLWVYYKEDSGQPVIERPLLIYVKVNTNDKWYHTAKKWELTSVVRGDPNGSTPGISGQAQNLITGKLTRQGIFFMHHYVIKISI